MRGGWGWATRLGLARVALVSVPACKCNGKSDALPLCAKCHSDATSGVGMELGSDVRAVGHCGSALPRCRVDAFLRDYLCGWLRGVESEPPGRDLEEVGLGLPTKMVHRRVAPRRSTPPSHLTEVGFAVGNLPFLFGESPRSRKLLSRCVRQSPIVVVTQPAHGREPDRGIYIQRLRMMASLLPNTPSPSIAATMSPTVVNGTHNSTRRTDEGVRILTPNAMLGYGYVPAHFWLGIERYRPHAIVVDSGSTDGGPYKLALGKMTCARQSYERDLSHMLQAAYHYGIKVLIGSAGGSGSNKHVDGMLEIINDICKREGYRFKTAAIYSGVTREHMSEHLAKGTVRPCGPVPDLTQREIDSAADMVAQIGVEPYLTALQDGADIIVAGRSYDPAPFAAFGQFHGIEAGVAWHCGKIMECGGICAVPKGRSMLATLHKDPDCFDLVPLNLTERCTPLSVAAHTLYEKTRPDLLPGPGGVLHLDGATYEQLPDNRTVRVRGAQFVPNEYNVKVEGAEIVGFRTIFIGGVRDPILISQIDKFLDAVHTYTSNLFPALRDGECQLLWHKYGANAVMGPLEPVKTPAHELGIMGEVVAPSQDLADAIANSARTSCLHMPYEGQLATTGNFASPLTPLEQPCGPVARFSIYHLIPCPEPANWPIKTLYLGVESPAERRAVPPMEVPTHIPDAVVVAGSSSFTAPAAPTPLASLAKVVRSKNSGPFELTLDVMFSEPQSYAYVKAAGILNQELIKKAYQIRDEDIMHIGWFEPALAWKCTIVRPWEQGSVGERDTLGTAQHAPLLDLVVPVPLSKSQQQQQQSVV